MANYNVCVARKYKDAQGQEKTHWWNVGKAFTFETRDGTEGLNIKLYSRTLMVDELSLFPEKEREAYSKPGKPARASTPEPEGAGEDDIPF